MTLDKFNSLIFKFESWSMEYFKIGITLKKLTASLTEYGVIVATFPPVISIGDPSVVTKLKEEIIVNHKKQQEILKAIEGTGALVLDTTMMEILIYGGPHPDSFLSWQPGEGSFGHWRETFDKKSERKTLKTDKHGVKETVLH